METVIVHIEVAVNPTEDEEKVKKAITNILYDPTFTSASAFQGYKLKATAQGQASLTNLRNLLRNDRIRDTARNVLYRAIRDDKISFYVNKQVAYAGHVSFSEEYAESPLGPIYVVIETTSPKHLVDWLAEKTEKK
ncbi:MAG: hypothetical protein LBC12_00230 [Nitrososphaerota archaeon]|jgi:predicted RNA binding protein with dsRBD fold (UPF0201 family)|nr:hypothetical protein [Nitrososphaerota archaeon]